VDAAEQLGDTRRPHTDSLDDGHTELASECVLVYDDAALAREIAHVEREQQRHAEPLECEHQAQVLTEIRGVGNADDCVGFRFAVATAEQHVGGHLFVGRRGLEAIEAGQIENADAFAGWRDRDAFLALDCHARVVRDLLAAAGEQVEERGLAAVRIADQRDQLRGASCDGTHDLLQRRDSNAVRFQPAQCESGGADADRDGLASERAAREHVHALAREKAEVRQASRQIRRHVRRVRDDADDAGGLTLREIAQGLARSGRGVCVERQDG
jgi:hypothetical protein